MLWVSFSSKEPSLALLLNTKHLGLRILHVHESEADAFHPHPKDKTLSPATLQASLPAYLLKFAGDPVFDALGHLLL